MNLKGRLKLIADKVRQCKILCDIGTDHAYIPIYLAGKGICERAIATDAKRGPIFIAQENIKKYGLETLVDARIGSGLEPVCLEEIDTVIVAGMGGMLIREILSDGIKKAEKADRLILQPMNAVEVVREWLCRNGFEILDEELAEEGCKLYVVIEAKWTGNIKEGNNADFYIGEKLAKKRGPLIEKYLNAKIRQLEKIIAGMSKSNSSSNLLADYIKIQDRLYHLIESAEEEYEH